MDTEWQHGVWKATLSLEGILFLPKDRKDPITFSHSHRSSLPASSIFISAWLSSAGSCHLRQSPREEPQIWWTLSKTPASPISTHLLPDPLQTSPASLGATLCFLCLGLPFPSYSVLPVIWLWLLCPREDNYPNRIPEPLLTGSESWHKAIISRRKSAAGKFGQQLAEFCLTKASYCLHFTNL